MKHLEYRTATSARGSLLVMAGIPGIAQGEDEERTILGTLDLAWDLLSILPAATLSRLSEADLAKYQHPHPICDADE